MRARMRRCRSPLTALRSAVLFRSLTLLKRKVGWNKWRAKIHHILQKKTARNGDLNPQHLPVNRQANNPKSLLTDLPQKKEVTT
jgi:hypothetical protein